MDGIYVVRRVDRPELHEVLGEPSTKTRVEAIGNRDVAKDRYARLHTEHLNHDGWPASYHRVGEARRVSHSSEEDLGELLGRFDRLTVDGLDRGGDFNIWWKDRWAVPPSVP